MAACTLRWIKLETRKLWGSGDLLVQALEHPE